ncbi:head-tail connector protein [Listeria monocytogenes]|uniref:head-tail connector protein n=1 Tax=Listeria TaxID=1637 RepID=UPI000435A076|nr:MULTISPECIES: head-tail connector protein [Listeria]EAA0100619.1 phage gp6-like head-tail connector protein [Listeria monocytogenes]EAC2431444.1 phage gp6-like head-tail connector protein [Listeria monocytogenes]EAC4160603.1 phage gp6-like head-tail connector protein [Listeria monocytogenes]EAC5700570.1 phage gp6-like head-tail connector protein [Listeria monocytogenes]EAC6044086.1 phage gp6-like head-tail connector protein [Listeria monocytogenes]
MASELRENRITLKTAKEHLKIEHEEDDEIIQNVYLPAAESEVIGAVTTDSTSVFFDSNPVFKIATLLLLSSNYENRKATSLQKQNEVPFALVSYIQRLRGDYARWNLKNSRTE